MHPAVRCIALGVVAAASVTCADSTAVRQFRGFAHLALAPIIQEAPSGGPDIDVAMIRGVLTNHNATDSVVVEVPVAGDSAILEFTNVSVTGDSTSYTLGVQAFDQSGDLVFEGTQELKVKPGNNAPAAPVLEYTATDADVTSIDIQEAAPLELRWAGAKTNACLNRATPPEANATIEKSLTVKGNPGNRADVRVGWTSRNTAIATVDSNGLVKSQCSNKSTYVVARTFLNAADSILVNVTAPPFSLLMSPDSINLSRGDSTQLTAVVVDENGNAVPAAQVTWATSDATRLTVGPTGKVRGIRNGRVLVTASSENRTTVGIVQVVRPAATSVFVIPQKDTIAFGQVRQYFAKAIDALGRVIGDATEFQWSSSRTTIATINSANGVATAQSTPDTTVISATIDGKTGSAAVKVVSSLPPGSLKGFVKDGATDSPLAGASIGVSGGSSVTSITDGSFLLGGVKAGDDITISKTGYVTVTFFDAPAFPNQTIQVPNFPLSPSGGGDGTMNGTVINALTGSGVSGMDVKAYAGLHSAPSPRRPNATPVATTSTSGSGAFSFVLAAGAYTFVATGSGYSEGIGVGISVSGQTKITPNIIIPPTTTGGGMYIVLTWGQAGSTVNMPADLDAHLTGPLSSTDTNRFQVYSGNRAHIVADDTVAALDVPDATGPGPEVMSIRPAAPLGVYRYYVRYPGASASSRAIADSSSARVDLFQDGHLLATFFPPAGQPGSVWDVFKYDGARIFPAGTIGQPATPLVLPLRGAVPKADPIAEPRRRAKP